MNRCKLQEPYSEQFNRFRCKHQEMKAGILREKIKAPFGRETEGVIGEAILRNTRQANGLEISRQEQTRLKSKQ